MPTAVASWAAQASYMAVWTTARARATTVGPGRVARISASVCSSHFRTTSSVAAGPQVSKLIPDLGPSGLAGLGGGGGFSFAEATGAGPKPASTRATLRPKITTITPRTLLDT